MPTIYRQYCLDCPYCNGKHLPTEYWSMRSMPLSMEDNNGDTLLIFQSPGIEEWKKGKPLSSHIAQSAGGKLKTAFKLLGKSRENYSITNTVQCFPGKQEPNNGKKPRDKQPVKAAQNLCSNWLLKDIEAHEYKLIVVFGSHAHKAVKNLGFSNDKRFRYALHPTAPGVSIDDICNILSNPRVKDNS